MATAIVSGALANKPLNGGEAWVRLSWILGLQRLGFDTYFVEEIGAGDCVDENGVAIDFAASINRSYFESVVHDFGLEERAGLLCDGGRESAGLGREEIREAAVGADVFLNISGHLTVEEILRGPRVSVYVDLDPGFTQFWHSDPAVPFHLAPHDRYVTVGLNVGAPDCPIPDCGVEWIATLPPVLLEAWQPRPPSPSPPRFTTVATWRSPSGRLELEGRETTLKHHQFRRLIELPERVGRGVFEIALDIHPGDSADLEALAEHGWKVVNPRLVAATPRAFRDYILDSGAEFSVAQGIYAETRSGWFSDRTAAYLAGGRPALVQSTGVGDGVPIGEGLLTFSTLDEAILGAECIASEHSAQSSAARRIATACLDSDIVLERLLTALGIERESGSS